MLNVTISSLDHVVFNTADAERSLRFYTEILGLEPVRVAEYRAGKAPFPSARINAHTILDFFPPDYHKTTPGGNNVNHIAMTVDATPEALEAFLRERAIEIVRRMTENFAAQGTAHHAFHIKDPDGNLVELHTYAESEREWHPRRGRSPLGRFLWLKRVADKARAFANGTIGEYIYPCPIDRGTLERWGVTPEEFAAAAAAHPDDASLLAWAESTIALERSDSANSWISLNWLENLDRQDREELSRRRSRKQRDNA